MPQAKIQNHNDLSPKSTDHKAMRLSIRNLQKKLAALITNNGNHGRGIEEVGTAYVMIKTCHNCRLNLSHVDWTTLSWKGIDSRVTDIA